ncbi:hypothetical protein AZE42_11237 [Rhizopogon vesiculosus]|uniref:Uncharacterized protein n=1 Tax=Rhizopogon vesiculosus TaxID=180088 RepID=A0A1J8R549_9AGAM|nr:hypothetical protein AZE42_11237 [Rhizopogon vesiculosus]
MDIVMTYLNIVSTGRSRTLPIIVGIIVILSLSESESVAPLRLEMFFD